MKDDTLCSEVIALGAELVARNLVLGSGGNLSYRQDDTVWITRSGALLHQLSPTDFLPLSLHENYQRPAQPPRPSTETPMHLAVYRARPQTRVLVHCHPRHAIAWAMQGRPLPACAPDFAIYLGAEVPTLPFHMPGESIAEALAPYLPHYPAFLLGNHGILVGASDVRLARLRTLHIEETAQTCLLAMAAGTLRPLQAGEIARIHATYGKK